MPEIWNRGRCSFASGNGKIPAQELCVSCCKIILFSYFDYQPEMGYYI